VNANRVKKLRWLCRRGMKELDILLEKFLFEHESELVNGAWPDLETLLQVEDDVLWDWVQNPQCPEASPYQPLLQSIVHGSPSTS